MRQIEITRATFVAGQRVEAGTVVSVDDRQASDLIAGGKGTAFVAPTRKGKDKADA